MSPHTHDAQRWRLELPGTAPNNTRALEAAVEDIGWQRLQTRTEAALGVTRIYMVTDRGYTIEAIAAELIEHYPGTQPVIARLEPTTWEKVRQRWRAEQDARYAHKHHRTVIPSG